MSDKVIIPIFIFLLGSLISYNQSVEEVEICKASLSASGEAKLKFYHNENKVSTWCQDNQESWLSKVNELTRAKAKQVRKAFENR